MQYQLVVQETRAGKLTNNGQDGVMCATYRPIGGSESDHGTCPDSCPFLSKVTYYDNGTPKVSRNSGECYGLGYLCHRAQVRSATKSDVIMPSSDIESTHVRINVTGDLMRPGTGVEVDTDAIDELKVCAMADTWRTYYGYTHSRDAVLYANKNAPSNLVIRLSCHTEDDVEFCKKNRVPYVYVSDTKPDGTIQCLNDKDKKYSCVTCKLCAKRDVNIWLKLR